MQVQLPEGGCLTGSKIAGGAGSVAFPHSETPPGLICSVESRQPKVIFFFYLGTTCLTSCHVKKMHSTDKVVHSGNPQGRLDSMAKMINVDTLK